MTKEMLSTGRHVCRWSSWCGARLVPLLAAWVLQSEEVCGGRGHVAVDSCWQCLGLAFFRCLQDRENSNKVNPNDPFFVSLIFDFVSPKPGLSASFLSTPHTFPPATVEVQQHYSLPPRFIVRFTLSPHLLTAIPHHQTFRQFSEFRQNFLEIASPPLSLMYVNSPAKLTRNVEDNLILIEKAFLVQFLDHPLSNFTGR